MTFWMYFITLTFQNDLADLARKIVRRKIFILREFSCNAMGLEKLNIICTALSISKQCVVIGINKHAFVKMFWTTSFDKGNPTINRYF